MRPEIIKQLLKENIGSKLPDIGLWGFLNLTPKGKATKAKKKKENTNVTTSN